MMHRASHAFDLILGVWDNLSYGFMSVPTLPVPRWNQRPFLPATIDQIARPDTESPHYAVRFSSA
jgi:hypothetical protein